MPVEIGKLRKAKSLSIARDSTSGWTVYPPASAFRQRVEIPPFRHLPDEITGLTTLTKLDLMLLDLKTLPENFGELQNLDTLYLSLNKLTISTEMGKLKELKNLKYLDVSGNKVDTADINELKRANPQLFIRSGLE